MKIKYLKLKSWLLVTAMGALGLSSCHSQKKLAEPEQKEPERPAVREREEMRLMYGVPTMHYMIRGQVKDEAGKPVKGIRINLLEHGIKATADTIYGDQENVKKYLKDTEVATDAQGRFVVQGSDRPFNEVRLLVRDADGKENGEYRNQLLELTIDDASVDRSQADRWNRGTFNKDLEIKLEGK